MIDFPKSTKNIENALRLLAKLLPEASEWDEIKAAAGQAIAQSGNPSAVQNFLTVVQRSQVLFGEEGSNERSFATFATIRGLLAFLRP